VLDLPARSPALIKQRPDFCFSTVFSCQRASTNFVTKKTAYRGGEFVCTLKVPFVWLRAYMQLKLAFIIGKPYYSQEKGRVKPFDPYGPMLLGTSWGQLSI
jgi:hypothetical protein